jgi:hypothetical protein
MIGDDIRSIRAIYTLNIIYSEGTEGTEDARR